MSKSIASIRYTLTALLLFGVYTETGIWTALILSLAAIRLEADS